MTEPTLLALDQGTSGTTGLLITQQGEVVARAYCPVKVSYPRPGWVEQDPLELEDSVRTVLHELEHEGRKVLVAGLSNQRETVIFFDRATLEPLGPAIVWQCRRGADLCARLRNQGHEPRVRELTGLLLDPYFSATKIAWWLAANPDRAAAARDGRICAATVDAWITARITSEHRICTDHSNASRTLLYDVNTGAYSDELSSLFSVPLAMLPEIVDTAGRVGTITFGNEAVPLSSIIGDQQAALFGQGCVSPGMAKNTYGTGSFLLVNAGAECPVPAHGLLSTVAWSIAGRRQFALEGSIFTTGAAIKWLVEAGLLDAVESAQKVATSVPDSAGVSFVPALAGLGSPFWDDQARAAFVGITGGTTRAHLVRAVVDSIAYRTMDVVDAMAREASVHLVELRVDGGASSMEHLCQLQADLLAVPVARASSSEATARGAAMMAGVAEGILAPRDVQQRFLERDRFMPRPVADPDALRSRWASVVTAVRGIGGAS